MSDSTREPHAATPSNSRSRPSSPGRGSGSSSTPIAEVVGRPPDPRRSGLGSLTAWLLVPLLLLVLVILVFWLGSGVKSNTEDGRNERSNGTQPSSDPSP